MERSDIIKEIAKIIRETASASRESANFMGSPSSDAHLIEQRLEYWLDGIHFANTGKTKVYSQVLNDIITKADPEYQEYLRLSKKFNKG